MCPYIGFWCRIFPDKGELRNKSVGLRSLKKGVGKEAEIVRLIFTGKILRFRRFLDKATKLLKDKKWGKFKESNLKKINQNMTNLLIALSNLVNTVEKGE